ncbi:DgyrCDS1328 [Dimorphilus gyrociliatus]|uniref:Hypoxia up-regulated protein 1 n=1 Tax=Dimorphilus gyrociliatus TaxID=2664684 RepID=A0A7I8V735_9ANNE|nr:DgyrCDS1328 [Dimorphilus gyrociliatus]
MWAVKILLLFITIQTATAGLAVMSVDLGAEFMKVAIVKPGVPMEVALSKESKRKTDVVISYRDGDRSFGGPAMSTAVKYPRLAYRFLKYIVGKKADSPSVKEFLIKFPYYKIEAHPETGFVQFLHDGDDKYTVEELLAMILEYAQEIASHFAEQPVNEAVITVPPFFNQAERRSLARAADLAGIKLLQLMNDNAAVALNYGVFRRKAFNTTAQHYMFFDVGSISTKATIVSYQLVKTKNPVTGIVDTDPQVTIKGVGYDRNLGGLDWTLRLREHLAKRFEAVKKTKNVLRDNNRAMAKLLKEADRLKQVLSANADHYAQIENLMDEEDFRTKVTRSEFEEMTDDLFERIAKPVKDALKTSQVTMDEIHEVILMGAGTRMPKIQEILKKTLKLNELGKSINTDEAAALGAVYQAAHLSKGFRVKKFTVKDAAMYPIIVRFNRMKESNEEETRVISRTLFNRMNNYPQKKVMIFNKQLKDFDFNVLYGDMSFLSPAESEDFGSTELLKVKLAGVEDAHNKYNEKAEAKGVKAHFKMDDSGILFLDRVEAAFERPPDAPEEESTFQKLGSTISNLFGGSKPGEEGKDEQKPEEKKDNESIKKEEPKEDKKEDKKEKETDKSKFKKENNEEPDKTESGKNKKTKEQDKTEKTENTETKNEESKKTDKENDKKETKDSDKKEQKKEPAKATIVKEHLSFSLESLDSVNPSDSTIKISRNLLKELKQKDEEKIKLAAAKNDVESFIINYQDKLYQDEYQTCSKEEEREKLSAALSGASDWFYDQDDSVPRKTYEDKLAELEDIFKDINNRVKEIKDQPQAWEAMRIQLNHSEVFIAGMKNFTGEDSIFTQVEYDTLDKLINKTREWSKEKKAEVEKANKQETLPVQVTDIYMKLAELDREIRYLASKAKNYRPKPKVVPTNDTNSNTTDTSQNKTSETKDDKKEEFVVPEKAEESEEKRKPKHKSTSEDSEKSDETLQLDGNTDQTTPPTQEDKDEL